jgi:hypothetical protein
MELNQCNEVKIFSYIFLCNIRASHHYPAKFLSGEFSEGFSGAKNRTRDFLSMGRQAVRSCYTTSSANENNYSYITVLT